MKGFLTALGVLAGSYFLIYCSSDIGVMSTDDLSREGTALVTLKDVKAHDASLPGINLKNNVLEQSSIDCLSNELKRKHLLESLGNLKIDSATILKLETKEIRGRYTTFLEVSYQIQDPQKNKTTLFFRTNGYGRNVLSGKVRSFFSSREKACMENVSDLAAFLRVSNSIKGGNS